MFDVLAKTLALLAAEANELVAGHEEKWESRELLGVGRNHDLLWIHTDICVLDDRIENVGSDFRVVIPVARIVAESCERELGAARTRRKSLRRFDRTHRRQYIWLPTGPISPTTGSL